jgi:hypothetical protein
LQPVTIAAPKSEIHVDPLTLHGLPVRKGPRPRTLRGPLHIQYSGHSERKYINQLVKDVFTWPHIERAPDATKSASLIPIRFEGALAMLESTPLLSEREFARVFLGAPTIYLALPLVSAHWAIVRGWAEPHYLCSFGLMPPGTVVLYVPQDREGASVCYSLFHTAYQAAFNG